MADEENINEEFEEDGEAVEETPASGGFLSNMNPALRKKLIIGLIALGVIIIEAGISYVVVSKLMAAKQAQAAEVQSSERTQTAAASEKAAEVPTGNVNSELDKIGGLYTLSDVIVNPAYSQGRRYFVVDIVFAFEEAASVDLATEREPILKDRVSSLLAQRTSDWYANYTNKEILRHEILQIAKEVLGPDQAMNIFFTKYVLQ